MILTKQLGMVPAWQFDQSWPQNPKYNQFVQFPQGVDQLTPQPIGPNYALPAEPGLGAVYAGRGCCDGGNAPDDCCSSIWSRAKMLTHRARTSGMHGLGLGTYSKWALVGGIALVGITLVSGFMLARHKR